MIRPFYPPNTHQSSLDGESPELSVGDVAKRAVHFFFLALVRSLSYLRFLRPSTEFSVGDVERVA